MALSPRLSQRECTAMNRVEEEMSKLILALLELRLARISKMEWLNLTLGRPDTHTKELVRSLMVKMVDIITRFVRQDRGVLANKDVLTGCLMNAVPKAFATIMTINETTSTHASSALIVQIVEEVCDQVQHERKKISVMGMDLLTINCCAYLKDLFQQLQDQNIALRRKRRHPSDSDDEERVKSLLPCLPGKVEHRIQTTPEPYSYEKCVKDHADKREGRTVLLEKLVEDFIRLVFEKAKLPYCNNSFEYYRERLVKKLWTETELLECYVDMDNLQKLHETIYGKMFKMLSKVGLNPVKCLIHEPKLFDNLLARAYTGHMLNKPIVCKTIVACPKTDCLHPTELIGFECLEMDATGAAGSKVCSKAGPLDQPLSDDALSSSFVMRVSPAGIPPEDILKAKMENCNLVINNFLTTLIPHIFRKAGEEYSKETYDHLFQRMYDKLWELCKTYDFVLRKNPRDLVKRTYKNLYNFCLYTENVTLMCMKLTESACDDIVAKTFEKHFLIEKCKVPLITTIKKSFLRPFQCCK